MTTRSGATARPSTRQPDARASLDRRDGLRVPDRQETRRARPDGDRLPAAGGPALGQDAYDRGGHRRRDVPQQPRGRDARARRRRRRLLVGEGGGHPRSDLPAQGSTRWASSMPGTTTPRRPSGRCGTCSSASPATRSRCRTSSRCSRTPAASRSRGGSPKRRSRGSTRSRRSAGTSAAWSAAPERLPDREGRVLEGSRARADFHEFHFWLAISLVGLGETDAARDELELALENSTTRRDHDVYAAKLSAKLTRESRTVH